MHIMHGLPMPFWLYVDRTCEIPTGGYIFHGGGEVKLNAICYTIMGVKLHNPERRIVAFVYHRIAWAKCTRRTMKMLWSITILMPTDRLQEMHQWLDVFFKYEWYQERRSPKVKTPDWVFLSRAAGKRDSWAEAPYWKIAAAMLFSCVRREQWETYRN